MRKLWVVLAACGCATSNKAAMGPPPAPAKIAASEQAEPVERGPAPQVTSDPEEGGQVASSTPPPVASDPEEGGQVASAAGPATGSTTGLAGIGATGEGAGGGVAIGQGRANRPSPSVSPGAPQVSGDIDRDALRKIVKRHFNEIKYCYERVLQKNPTLQGRVEVVFQIEKDGTVSDAKADGIDPDLDRCIEGRFKMWEFPKQPKPAQVTYPIVFNPA